MNNLIAILAGICAFNLIMVALRYRFEFLLRPKGFMIIKVCMNNKINEDLHIYLGYNIFDVILWSLVKADDRIELQIQFTFFDNNR